MRQQFLKVEFSNSSIQNSILGTREIALGWMQKKLTDDNIGSGRGLVLSGNKPLPETILTQIYVTI